MRFTGGMPGSVIIDAAARNLEGSGSFNLTGTMTMGADGLLSWTAPESSTAGPGVDVSAGGYFLLEDGSDPSAWLWIQIFPAYLPTAGQWSVYIEDQYSAVGLGDLSAANAAAGLVTTTEFGLLNVTLYPVTNLLMWIGTITTNLQISQDGTNYYTPTSSTDAHVLSWSSLASNATANVWLKRTITAGASSNPLILNQLEWQWTGN